MTIKLQLPDAVYASLMKGNARVQGTIALVSPREGNFNVHSRKRNPSAREYRKLPHGRVSMSSENLRLTLSIDFDEHGIHPAQVLIDESITASQYIMGGPNGPKQTQRTLPQPSPRVAMGIAPLMEHRLTFSQSSKDSIRHKGGE